jgi:hypothetical protein
MNARQSELESMIARISNLLDTKARAEAALATTTSTGGGGGAKTNLVADAVKSPTGPKNPLDTVVKGTSLTWNEINRVLSSPVAIQSAARYQAMAQSSVFKNVPKMAQGGIVNRPTLAMIGEKGPEAVIPLNKAGGMGGGAVYNITVNAGIGTSGQEVGKQIVEAIKKFERSSGPVFAKA